MQHFTEEDFKKVPYKIYPLSNSLPLLTTYSDLRNLFEGYKDFCVENGLVINLVVRYIIFLYDEDSGLQKRTWKSPVEKKVQAAYLAGFRYDEETGFDNSVTDMLQNKYTEINQMIVLYLRMQGSMLWTSFCTYYEVYYKAVQELLNGEPNKNKLEYMKEAKKQLSEIMLEMGRGNEIEEGVSRAFFMISEEDRKGFRPEDIIKKMRSGEYVGIIRDYGRKKRKKVS